jgi:hypothetical protein
MWMTYSSSRLIVECKQAFTSEFEMKDLGMMHYFLGLEVWQRIDEIFLSQEKYTVEILKKFGMTECKSMPTPMVMDLKKMNDASTDSVNVLSQFMIQPRQTHWIAAKHVLRYLRGTVGYGLRYASSVDLSL